MFNGELSLLNDHTSTNHLADGRSDQQIRLQLRYNDPREGLKELKDAQFPVTATIYDVTKEFLKLVRLDHICPQDVNLLEFRFDNRYAVPTDNAHMTLKQLRIVDGCTLCFAPSLTSISLDSSILTIYGPNFSGKKEWKWNESTTTLNMLLEFIIKIFSLESIEPERIHLFKFNDELDLISNPDKLLIESGILNGSWITVHVVPSGSSSVSFANTTMSDGQSSSLNTQTSTSSSPHADSTQRISVKLQYMDHKQDIKRLLSTQFSPTATIRDVTSEILKLALLEQIRPEDVNLIKICLGTQHYSVPVINAHMTLKDLKIEEGDTFYFERSSILVPVKPLYLILYYSTIGRQAEYKWYENSTTLGMLLEYVIEEFHLQSVERKRIRLSKRAEKSFDQKTNSDKFLSNLGIINHDRIYVETIASSSFLTTNEDSNVCVECIYMDEKFFLDVPYNITIDELKNRIEKRLEGHLLIDFRLYDAAYIKVFLSDTNRTLSYLGVRSGQTIYATLRLAFSRNQPTSLNVPSDTLSRSSSSRSIVRRESDEVDVICKFSMNDKVIIQVSVKDTVAELTAKVAALRKDRPLAQFLIWSAANFIDDNQPDRRLYDFGIKSGSVIEVSVMEINPTHSSTVSRYVSTTSIPDRTARTYRFDSTPTGLSNLGNTCFMNSALQCLAHAKPLTQFFLDGLTRTAPEDDKHTDTEWNSYDMFGAVTGAYADLMRNLWQQNQSIYSLSSFNPSRIKEAIGLRDPRFATWEQQDAQEFMTFLLDEIHKEFKGNNKDEPNTIIKDLFFGTIESTITCSECKHVETTTNPISFLSLPLIQQERTFIVKFITKDGENEFTTVNVSNNGQVKHIIQAFADSTHRSFFCRTIIVMTDDGPLDLDMPLDKLTMTEVTLVEEADFTSSSRYDRLSINSKKLTLEDCLQEFCSPEKLEDLWLCQQENCKKTSVATKQLRLCTLPPILIIQFKRFSHKNGIREKIETFVEYPTNGLDLRHFLPSSEDGIYDLFAVCKHIGSIYGGHYIACARHEKNGKKEWYKFDDSYVSSFCYDTDIVSNEAYLLFYIKRDMPKQSTAVTTS